MLSGQDDFIGHQTSSTFDHVHSSDPAWMERMWYTGHPLTGDMIFDIGLGYHPNRNVMDVFAGVTIGSRQYNFRASRRLRPNPLDTTVGPLKIEILDGLHRHRLQLQPNDSGLAFDIQFIATMNPHEEHPHFRRRQGRVTEDMARFQQLGRYQGWIEVDGKRYPIDQEQWLGQRDHSWGVRSEMRTDESHPPVTFYPPFLFFWATVQFAGRGLHVFLKERAPGEFIYVSGEEVLPLGEKPDQRRKMVDVIDHRIQWADDPMGQTVQSAEIGIRLANGVEKTLHIRASPARYFLKGGLYGGLDGWFQGDDKGALYIEHEQWDLTCAKTREKLRTLSDHVIEVREGGEVGYGIIEYGVGKGYERYDAVQVHPAI